MMTEQQIGESKMDEMEWSEWNPLGKDQVRYGKLDGRAYRQVAHARWTTENERFSLEPLGRAPRGWSPEDGKPLRGKSEDEVTSLMTLGIPEEP